jgi:hypothetical protein
MVPNVRKKNLMPKWAFRQMLIEINAKHKSLY